MDIDTKVLIAIIAGVSSIVVAIISGLMSIRSAQAVELLKQSQETNKPELDAIKSSVIALQEVKDSVRRIMTAGNTPLTASDALTHFGAAHEHLTAVYKVIQVELSEDCRTQLHNAKKLSEGINMLLRSELNPSASGVELSFSTKGKILEARDEVSDIQDFFRDRRADLHTPGNAA